MEQYQGEPELVLNTRKTRKNTKKAKKMNVQISRKSLLRVEEVLKAEYKKYVNSIKRKKPCKVKTFREFARERMGKKTRRGKKVANKSKPESKSFFALPSSEPSAATEPTKEPSAPPAEETSVAAPPSPPAEESSSAPSSEQNSTAESTTQSETSTPASTEESKPAENEGGIMKSITDTLGLSSSENKGGKKSKRRSKK